MKRLIYLFAIILISSACISGRNELMKNSTPTEVPQPFMEIWESGLNSGIPCAPSCLIGIVPGITTEKEAMDLLQKHGISEWCEIVDDESQGGVRGVICDELFLFDYRTGTDIIESVSITPLSLYTVSDVIATYGPPDFVEVYLTSLPDYSPKVQMRIYYKTFFAMILLLEQDGEDYIVESDTTIENIFFWEETYFQESYLSDSQKWHGYGRYPFKW